MTQDDSLYVIRFSRFSSTNIKGRNRDHGVTIEHAFGESLGKTARRIYRGICRPSGNCSTAKKHAVITVHEMAEELDAGAVLGTLDQTPFFALVRAHTIQGTFCDPAYGGNANFVGWDLIGYPGVRLNVTAADQRMAAPAKPIRRSAYDYAMFAAGAH